MQLPARGALGVCWRKLIALSAFVTSDTTEEKALRADIAAALSKPAQVCPRECMVTNCVLIFYMVCFVSAWGARSANSHQQRNSWVPIGFSEMPRWVGKARLCVC